MTTTCPCGTAQPLAACCGPIIDGTQKAATAEALMRSRYTAYSQRNVDYILETHDPATRTDLDPAGTRDWANRTTWLELDVLATKDGGPNDDRGEVEFKARFADDKGNEQEHHELSTFVKHDGRWYFEDCKLVRPAPITRSEPKIGRNDPCPCGSGKKHKKCCGARAR